MEIPAYWLKTDKPALLLAPMEGVTDAPMREFMGKVSSFSGSVTEFFRVSQDPLPAHVIRRDFPEVLNHCRTRYGLPVQLQLLGGDPDLLAETARIAVEAGALGIDLNFGCPAPTVNRRDGGASLLRDPERLGRIVRAVREAVPARLPVSAKLRLGWDRDETVFTTVEKAVAGGASWITLHGRTRVDGYAPPARWEPIGEIQKRYGKDLPIVANGDLWTLDDFRRCRDITGCSHFMIGRGALADPTLSASVAHELGLPTRPLLAPLNTSSASWAVWVADFLETNRSFGDDNLYLTRRLKQWLRYAHVRGTFRDFDRIKVLQRAEEILQALRLALPDASQVNPTG